MDDRLAGLAAMVVGASLAAVGAAEYLRPGLGAVLSDPFATGVLVVGAGTALFGAGAVAVRAALDHLALRIVTAVGLFTLALAVLQPAALEFGGVFWLAMVSAGLVVAGAYRTLSHAEL
jgi:hypothetical protein